MGIRTTSAGLKKLAKAYEIGTIYTNAYDKATYNDSERETIAASCGQWVRVKAGDSLSLGGWRRRSWLPQRAYSDEEDDNNNSLVVRLSHGDVRFLLMGDATFLIEEALLDQGADVAADFLKAGRHGKADANTQAFLEAVSPQVAYLTGQPGGRPGFPGPGGVVPAGGPGAFSPISTRGSTWPFAGVATGSA